MGNTYIRATNDVHGGYAVVPIEDAVIDEDELFNYLKVVDSMETNINMTIQGFVYSTLQLCIELDDTLYVWGEWEI